MSIKSQGAGNPQIALSGLHDTSKLDIPLPVILAALSPLASTDVQVQIILSHLQIPQEDDALSESAARKKSFVG